MAKTRTYTVPVQRKMLDVYRVEAVSSQDAAVQAGVLMATEAAPFSTTELSRTILSVKPLLDDTDESF